MELHADTLIFAVINFCILLFILRSLLFKPIMASLDARKAEIEGGLAKAEEAERKLNELNSERARLIDEARNEAQALRASIATLAEEEKSHIIAEARAEAERLLAKAQEQIAKEREKAVAALRNETAALAIAAAAKVIGRNITSEDDERLVDEFLREVSN